MIIDWLKSLRSATPPRRRISLRLAVPTPLESRALLSSLPIGPEFRVNTYTTSVQWSPSIGVDADGDYVITWASFGQDGSNYGVYAQRYNAAGVAQGTEFRVNSYTTGIQSHPSIGMDADGDFVITWNSDGQDGAGTGIYAQRYNALGVAQGTEFRVNSYTTSSQVVSSIGMDADGDFIVTWRSYGQDGSGYGVYAQRYNAAGVAQGPEFRVNSYTTGYQRNQSIGVDADGDFVISWESSGQDGSGYGVYAQRYNAAGVAQGPEFPVNSYTTNSQYRASIGMDADGDFVITWDGFGQEGSSGGIYAQRYNAAGVALGSEFHVNSYTTGFQYNPSIGVDADGDFVISWESSGQDGSGYGVYAQRYNAAGMAQGPEFRVNSYTTGYQRNQSIGVDADGDFVITWDSDGQDGSGLGVYAQRYRADHEDYVGTWRTGAFYLDSNHSDNWSGSTKDTLNSFGATTDKPIVGDWNGDGYDDIGVWRNGTFFLDANGNGVWDGAAIDRQFVFGNSTDTPLVGDWNRDRKDDVGVWRGGIFYLDLNANRILENNTIDGEFEFGAVLDTPVIGDWNGDGTDDIGVWRAGRFFLDLNGNRRWDRPAVDTVFFFGNATDKPLIGDWNGDGIDDVGVWRSAQFWVDFNGNRIWDGPENEYIIDFGNTTDTALIGYWRPKSILGAPPAPLPGALPPGNSPISNTTPPPQPDEQTLASLLAPPSKKRDR